MPKLSLEKLIHSLSQGELRAFSLSIKKDKNPSYYNLFNGIRSGKVDDSKKKDNNEIQRRNYLYNSILESLVKSSKTIDSQISKGLHHVEILYNRQLEKEAWKELEKVEKLANKHERFGYVIQILEWKKILGLRLDSFTEDDYKSVSKLETEIMDKYKTYLLAADSYHNLIQQKQRRGYVHELKDLPDFESLQKIESNHLPKRTLYYQRMAKAIHLCLVQDIPAQYELTKLIVEDAVVINEANECLQAYFEHLTSCICMGRFEELITLLKKLKLDVKKGKFGTDPNIRIKLFYYAANYETMAYTYMGNSVQLELKIKEVEMGLKKMSEALSTEMKLTIYSALKMGHFFLGNNKEAKKYLNYVILTENIDVRRDIYQDALFFSLLVNFDEINLDQIELILNKISTHCDLNKPHYKFESKLFSIFKTFLENSDSNKVTLFKDIIKANNQSGIPLTNDIKYTENYYGYFLWAYSRLNNEEVLSAAKSIKMKL
ncbi:MAG: hypothetical protein ACPGRC_03010 [Salibacteraceae bacterium]